MTARSPAPLLLLAAALAGCGADEEPAADTGSTDATERDGTVDTDADRDASITTDADLDGRDVTPPPPPDCDTAVDRFHAFIDANRACETDDDCAVFALNESCSCFYAGAVNASVAGLANERFQETQTCGVAPESLFVGGCVADAGPPLVVGCSAGMCFANATGSCLPWGNDAGPDAEDADTGFVDAGSSEPDADQADAPDAPPDAAPDI